VTLAEQFDEAMMQVYERATNEAGYRPTRFLEMLQKHGGVETARRLLPQVSDGFVQLWQRRRLDLTVEAVILDSRWKPLFTDSERDIAHERLRECGMNV
jgi:hypothetical protein